MPSPDELELENGHAVLTIPTGYGPRIAGFRLVDGANVFGDGAGAQRETPEGIWRAYGGHRLWAAPERFPQTYTIDDRAPHVERLGPGAVTVRRARDPRTGLVAAIEIELAQDAPEATVRHLLTNDGDAPHVLAAWGITVVRPGGVALLPNAVRRSQREALLPARTMAIWHYTALDDPRFAFGPAFVRLRCDPARTEPNKIGIAGERGWFAYLVDGIAFVVQAPYEPRAVYPDLGCSFEVYTEGGFCEVETLGPLRTVHPGETLEHVERWSLLRVGAQEDAALTALFAKALGE